MWPSIHNEPILTWKLMGSPAAEYPMGTTRPGIPVKLPSCMNLREKLSAFLPWNSSKGIFFCERQPGSLSAALQPKFLQLVQLTEVVPKLLLPQCKQHPFLPHGPDCEGHIAAPSHEVRLIDSWGSASNSCKWITKWLRFKGSSGGDLV